VPVYANWPRAQAVGSMIGLPITIENACRCLYSIRHALTLSAKSKKPGLSAGTPATHISGENRWVRSHEPRPSTTSRPLSPCAIQYTDSFANESTGTGGNGLVRSCVYTLAPRCTNRDWNSRQSSEGSKLQVCQS